MVVISAIGLFAFDDSSSDGLFGLSKKYWDAIAAYGIGLAITLLLVTAALFLRSDLLVSHIELVLIATPGFAFLAYPFARRWLR